MAGQGHEGAGGKETSWQPESARKDKEQGRETSRQPLIANLIGAMDSRPLPRNP